MTERNPGNRVHWLFGSDRGVPGRLMPRWMFLRALAAIYFSAFYSLLLQIKGLIGPRGILPVHDYLPAVARIYPAAKIWFAPTLFWLSSSSHALMIVTWIGLAASVAAFVNLWPRLSFFICFVCFLSFVSAAQDFSNYQSDGQDALMTQLVWQGLNSLQDDAGGASAVYFNDDSVGLTSWGTSNGGGLHCNCPLNENENEYEIVNNWTRDAGRHSIKFGGDGAC